MDLSTIPAIPGIAVVVFGLAFAYKSFTPEPLHKHIPALCGILGALLGLLSFALIPGYIAADNPITAAAIGIVSGFASTAVHQVYKQYFNSGTEE